MSSHAAIQAQVDVPMPDGPIEEPADWRGPAFANSHEWKYRLTPQDLAELDRALAHVKRAELPIAGIRSARDFPLQQLARRLESLKQEILHGRGFVLLQGMPVDDYSREDIACMYWGMSLYLGYPVSQNGKGHLLGHVTDLGYRREKVELDANGKPRPFSHTEIRGYNTREGFFFHTDSGDIVGLLCLHPAKSGGESKIASSVAIHNEIQRLRPDLLQVLYQPLWVSRQREVPANAKPYYQKPIFNWYRGKFACTYLRMFYEGCKIFPELPPLTPQQIEAFDLIDSLANDPKFHLSMTLEKGDVQYLSNYTVLHTRTEFEDYEEPERKRHLLRLWLVSPDARPLPAWYYDQVGGGRRAGVYVPGMTEVVSMTP